MAGEESDDSSKTEEPSHKKLEEARKRGQLVSSREVNHFFMMLALTFFIMALSPGMAKSLYALLAPFITEPESFEISGAGLSAIFHHVAWGAILVLALPLLATIVAAIAPAVVQNKFVVSAESIKPKLEKLSPLSGLGRIFGFKAIIEFLRNLLKITIIGTAACMVALSYRDHLALLPNMSHIQMLTFAQMVAGKMLIAAVIVLFLLAIGDYLYQRFIFMKRMRMTKQELRDEYRQQEGDPHIKQKLRAIRRDRARKRMMANVPKADVIITNPTHYAVALQYDAEKMAAPKLLAKGSDDVAARIREVASKHKIPIIRNPPLARVLYDTTKVDDEIPVEHYQAVAKVIGYVYKLQGKVPKKPDGAQAPRGPAGKGKKPQAGARPTIHMRKPTKK